MRDYGGRAKMIAVDMELRWDGFFAQVAAALDSFGSDQAGAVLEIGFFQRRDSNSKTRYGMFTDPGYYINTLLKILPQGDLELFVGHETLHSAGNNGSF